MVKKWVYESPPNDETKHVGPPIGRMSVWGNGQSGDIPNANSNDPEVIIWSGEQRSNTGHNLTLGSTKGFVPWTFGLGKVSRARGKVSRNKGTFKSAPGFEPGIWCYGRKVGQLARFVVQVLG